MTPERKAQWLLDLRSGKYPKTKKHLKDTTGYCCLGVLLATEPGVGFKAEPANCVTGTYFPHTLPGHHEPVYLHSGHKLSEAGRRHFGLERVDHDALTGLNDLHDTFEPVIAYIEAKL